jgi:uncharacterized membrane protein
MNIRLLTLAAPMVLVACQRSEAPVASPPDSETTASGEAVAVAPEPGAAPGDISDKRAYDGIHADEAVQFTGTEPFWGGNVSGATLTYTTPDNLDGTQIAVHRFAGRGGVSWSGVLQDKPFRLAVTEGKCSDGMSDRTYPFTATLELLGEQRQGCAWTGRRSFTPSTGGN